MQYVGVDAFKAGWLAVTRTGAGLGYRVFDDIDTLVAAFPKAERILIDVPIGLPWADVPVRPCDILARRLLGRPRRSSVFAVPCRPALHAQSFELAKSSNMSEIDRSVGAQTWAICPKIAEVDVFLRCRGTDGRLREIHPEVCFWALAGRRPMAHKKSTMKGRDERLHVLEAHESGIRSFLDQALSETFRKDVGWDDILDASAAFVTSEARWGVLTSLTGDPSHDCSGLPMEMLYLEIESGAS